MIFNLSESGYNGSLNWKDLNRKLLIQYFYFYSFRVTVKSIFPTLKQSRRKCCSFHFPSTTARLTTQPISGRFEFSSIFTYVRLRCQQKSTISKKIDTEEVEEGKKEEGKLEKENTIKFAKIMRLDKLVWKSSMRGFPFFVLGTASTE